MPLKTLTIRLADIEGNTTGLLAARADVEVRVAYTREVILTDGTIVPRSQVVRGLSSSGTVSVQVYPSDDTLVKSEYRGFAIDVTVKGLPGNTSLRYEQRVKVLDAMDSPISLGTLSPAEGVPAQWATVGELVDDMDAAVEAAETAETNAAAALASVGPAAVAAAAPAIAAAQSAQADAAQSAEDVQTALQAQFLTQDQGVAALIDTSAGPATKAALDAGYVGRPSAAEAQLFVTPRGSDANDGRTLDKAKATVASALSTLGGSAGTITLGIGTITETVPWGTIPRGVCIRGVSKDQTRISKAFSGNLATLGEAAQLADFTLDAQGATYTGTVFSALGAAGNQTLTNVTVINGDGPCLYMDKSAASNIAVINVVMYRVNAGTGTGRYAVVNQDDGLATAGAKPRVFIRFSSAGTCAIDFGSCDNWYISHSSVGDMRTTDNTRALMMVATRWLNTMDATLLGHNNVMVGCDINPKLTLGAGADAWTVGPGSFNRLPVVDNSGNGRNNVTHWVTTFTPVLYSGATVLDAGMLGNSVLSGEFYRSGGQITATYRFTVGTTAALPSGELRFGLPYARGSGTISACGQATITGGTAPSSTGVGQVPGAVGYARVMIPNGAALASLGTAQLPAGAAVYLTVTYGQ